jgi:hypothetical protein
VTLGANQPCTPQAFTPTLWAALLKEGAIVEIVPEPEQEPKQEVKPTAVTKRTRKPKAVKDA